MQFGSKKQFLTEVGDPMKTVKNKLKVFSLLVISILCAALLVACNGDGGDGITEIFVQKNEMPRLTYVQGQELDLSDGILTVVMDGETTPVPMDGEGVTVSGYNKDQLGPQTLTISYKGKTTTIQISVISRFNVEGHEENYFVGDVFDTSKGKLKVTKDDGTTISVNLNSDDINVKSFDSSKEGKATVTLVYTGDGQAQECSFQVNVHNVDKIELTVPKKTKYVSHETELNVSGGYLTVQAASPSTFSKYVTLTPEMVSGYDPSQVTYENRDQVVKQTLTVNYSGHQATFEVEITYSKVHLVQYVAEKLSNLDWTAEELPQLTKTQADDAIVGIQAYLELTPLEKDSIDEETMKKVLFPATIALRDQYLEHLETFADAFGISTDGYLVLIGKSYAAMETAVQRLEDPKDPFNTCAEVLFQIDEELGETPFQNRKITDLIITHTPETAQSIIAMFNYLMNLHDVMDAVPDDWTVDTLGQYETDIANAVSKITIGEYLGLNYNQMYSILSSWRANDDYFDIIYAYYYHIKEGGKEEITTKLWQKIPLPGKLNDWYMSFMRTLSEEQHMINNENTNPYLYDTVGFMYYYSVTNNFANEIKQGDDQLCKDLYELLKCDEIFDTNLRRGPRGYIYHMGAAMESKAIMKAWDQYLTIVNIYLTIPNATYKQYEKDFLGTFDALVDLAPSELYAFLSSVNYLYDSSRGNVLVMDCTARTYNTLMSLLAGFYSNTAPKDLYPVFCDLLLAMENYALCAVKDSALADFKTVMEKLQTTYEGLSTENRTAFDTYFGKCYGKYLSIYSRITASEPVDLGQWEAKLTLLKTTLEQYDQILSYVYSADITPEQKSVTMPLLFALYEKANAIHAELENAGENVKEALCTRFFTMEEKEYTLDHYFYAARELFVSTMVGTVLSIDQGGQYILWDLYHTSSIRPLLGQMADLLLAEHEGKLYEGKDVYDIMAGFRALPADQKNVYFILGVNRLYYAALERYFGSRTEGASELIRALIYAEINHSVYMHNSNDQTLADFTSKVEEMMRLYEQLANKEKFDACLGDMYALYIEKYNELKKA